MTPNNVQALFKDKHIVMTDASTEKVNFDEEGLQMVQPLHVVCSIQGIYFIDSPSVSLK